MAASAPKTALAAAQAADPSSMQSLYRSALALRRASTAFSGDLQWLPAPEGCLAFRRPGGLVCLRNLSGSAVPLPEGRVLESACRWYEFEVERVDDAHERTEIVARVVHAGRIRDVFQALQACWQPPRRRSTSA